MINILSFWPTTAGGWIGLISLIIGLIGSISALIPTAIKLFAAVKELVKNKNWTKIMAIADKAMEEAEKSGKSGAEKKEMAISIVSASCKELGVALDEELLTKLATYIEDTIAYFNDMTKATKAGKKAAKASQ